MLFDTLLIDLEYASSLRLIDRGLIKISGQAAEKFLQGLVTCDVSAIKLNPAAQPANCLGAHCNAKGRILFTFRLFYAEAHYFLSLPKSQVTFALDALKKYAVFSKVSIEDSSENVSLASLNLPASANPIDPWKLAEIETGIAEIYPQTREQFTPHELNYHQLNAVSFSKGCYIGQEIVARMHYLGKLKTELIHADLFSEIPPVYGDKIFYTDSEKTPKLAGYLVDFALVSDHQYKLLISLYTQAKTQTLWLGDTLTPLKAYIFSC